MTRGRVEDRRRVYDDVVDLSMRTYPSVETHVGSGLVFGWYLGNSLMTLKREYLGLSRVRWDC